MDADALIADLDGDQRRAVTAPPGIVAVIAGAGSGKTRVLTRRVAYRVVDGTADPAHTLVLTFTREAAGELRRRLPALGLTERVRAGTFHAFAQQVLRQRWADLDQRPRTIVHDRLRIVRELTGAGDADQIVEEMNWATARGLGPTDYAAARRAGRSAPVAAERVVDAFSRYRAEQRSRGIVDLDDLLQMTIDALQQDEEFAAATRWRFRHVLVDEAQDLNPVQHRLVDELRRGNDDLFLVGDPAQAIYGFNGADPTILSDVADHFPGVEVVRLPTNHRCTPQIVQAGAAALRAAAQDVDVVSGREDGATVEVVQHDDEHAEARWVAGRIARIDPSLVRAGRVAVLARTHAALSAVRAALAAAGVDVRRAVDGAGSPLTTPLSNAYRCVDNAGLRRVTFDLTDDTEDEAARDVGAALHEFLREHPGGDGPAFRAWVTANDPFGRDAPGVELMTFHGAKGREWHTVHLVGVETSLVPHRSATTAAAKAEEARLLYVALTRATDRLVVNWAERRGGYQRKLTPLLGGFESAAPAPVPPPQELLTAARSERSVALDRLRLWRAAAARSGGMVPDAVCTDHALGLIADRRPASADELDALTGWGPITSRRLYPPIREALDAPS